MKRITLFALVVTMLTACMQDSITEPNSVSQRPEYIYASFEEDTRVELNAQKKTVWTEGDRIVRIGQDVYDTWTFTGKTGDRSGSFQYNTSSSSTYDFDFNGKYYAFYALHNYFGGATFNTTGEPAFLYYVKTSQIYKHNTYDPESSAMLGSSDDGKNFTFYNLLGHLRLSFTGDKAVEKISLMGNNDEILSGIRYVKFDDFNVAAWYDDVNNVVTLYCNDPVLLTDTPTEFYFTILPTTFQNGISVTVNFTDGTVFPKSTTKSITVNRNTIQPMKCFDTGEIVWQTVSILHTGSKIYTPHIYGSSALSGYIYWGDDYMSDINSVPSYVYDDGKESHTVTIKSMGASIIEIDNCQGISEIDLTNF